MSRYSTPTGHRKISAKQSKNEKLSASNNEVEQSAPAIDLCAVVRWAQNFVSLRIPGNSSFFAESNVHQHRHARTHITSNNCNFAAMNRDEITNTSTACFVPFRFRNARARGRLAPSCRFMNVGVGGDCRSWDYHPTLPRGCSANSTLIKPMHIPVSPNPCTFLSLLPPSLFLHHSLPHKLLPNH